MLGDAVFGVIVTYRGCTIQLTHEGSEREWWIASCLADDGEDGVWVDGGAETIQRSLEICYLGVEAIENPDGDQPAPDDDDPGGW